MESPSGAVGCYKPEVRGLGSRWCHWNSFIDIILSAAPWPWGWLSLERKWVPCIIPGGKGGRYLGLTNLPPSCAGCHEIWEFQPPGTLRACPDLYIKHNGTTYINPLTPNDHYCGRTAPLTSKRCILYIYSTNIGTEYFKHSINLSFFSLQNTVCFIILTYLVPVLFTFYIQSVLK